MHRRRLPIGIQTFAKIRADEHYYVDKTGFIRQLTDEGTHYFNGRIWLFEFKVVELEPAGRALQQLKRHLRCAQMLWWLIPRRHQMLRLFRHSANASSRSGTMRHSTARLASRSI